MRHLGIVALGVLLGTVTACGDTTSDAAEGPGGASGQGGSVLAAGHGGSTAGSAGVAGHQTTGGSSGQGGSSGSSGGAGGTSGGPSGGTGGTSGGAGQSGGGAGEAGGPSGGNGGIGGANAGAGGANAGAGGATAGAGGANAGAGGATAGAGGANAGAGGALNIVRTVETRSPFGALTGSRSYILDGDFELSPASSIVPAWLAVDGSGNLTTVHWDTGGACVSGVFCARIASDATLLNQAVSVPPKAKVTLSVKVKPANGACSAPVAVLYVQTGAGADDGIQLSDNGQKPDKNGWCALSGTYDAPSAIHSAAVYVEANGVECVVDQVEVSASGGASTPAPPLPALGRAKGHGFERLRHRNAPPRLPPLPHPAALSAG